MPTATRSLSNVRPQTSLTQPGCRTDARCTSCGSDRLTELAMTLTDGSRVMFASCHKCERREWRQDGLELPIDRVLDKTRKR